MSWEARLSGLGCRQQYHDVVQASPLADHDPESEPTGIYLMPSSFGAPSLAVPSDDAGPSVWGFPFHAACWDILVEACSPEELDIQVLFDLCRSFPLQLGILNWGHDYGGVGCPV